MAINFPNSPIVGNTYDYNGVRYTYQANGYWAVTTPGTVGIASGAEVIVGTDDAKYLTPKSMEDSDFWSARNDGPGSGLDADTIDGLHLSGLIQKGSPAVTTETHKISNSDPRITYFETDGAAGAKSWSAGVNNGFFRINTRDDLDTFISSILTLDRLGGMNLAGSTVWTAGNDGPGSGLDADTLDTYHASAFPLREVPGDFWTGDVSYIEVGSVGWIGTAGAFKAGIGWNGYRNDSAGFTYEGVDGNTTTAGLVEFDDTNFRWRGGAAVGKDLPVILDVNETDIFVGGNRVWHQGNNVKSFAQNGYQKLASGLIIQWGELPSTAVLDNTITFPTTFPTACRSVVITHKVLTNGSDYVAQAQAFTTTNFLLKNQAATSSYSWIAIGY